jgi:antitoxin component HigA of HigAB toxin-antitoxin module
MRETGVEKCMVVDALMEKYGFDISRWQNEMGYDVTITEILSDSEIDAMVDYALTKKNSEWTPFAPEREFILEVLKRY